MRRSLCIVHVLELVSQVDWRCVHSLNCAHTGKYDNVELPPLHPVHRRELHGSDASLWTTLDEWFELSPELGNLVLVRCHHTDSYTLTHVCTRQNLHVQTSRQGSLRGVTETLPAEPAPLLVTLCNVKCEICTEFRQTSVRHVIAIDESPAVESITRELPNLRKHPVLHREQVRMSSRALQPLKHGLLDASFRASPRQYCRRQLLRVTDENSRTAWTEPSERYQRRRLCRLSSFVDDD
mmetsp:Transcript_13717/g.59884  ORF Transcript_13717/g.59884 Transcript_13717/m.59884 type:complete len:238 (-) Transcript_13717:5447-6160(-)